MLQRLSDRRIGIALRGARCRAARQRPYFKVVRKPSLPPALDGLASARHSGASERRASNVAGSSGCGGSSAALARRSQLAEHAGALLNRQGGLSNSFAGGAAAPGAGRPLATRRRSGCAATCFPPTPQFGMCAGVGCCGAHADNRWVGHHVLQAWLACLGAVTAGAHVLASPVPPCACPILQPHHSITSMRSNRNTCVW